MLRFIRYIEEHFWATITFLALPFFALLFQLLFGFRIIADGDILGDLYSNLTFIKSSLVSGQSLLWSTQVFSGYPIFILGAVLNPFFFLLRFFPVVGYYHWLIFINLTAAGVLMFVFLRRLRLDFWPAMLGAVVFPFSLWSFISNIGLVSALPILPALFLLIRAQKDHPAWWKLGLGGAVLGYSVYSVNFNLLPMILAGSGLYAVHIAVTEKSGLFLLFRRPVIDFVLMGIAGCILALPQLLSTYVYSILSERGLGLGFAAASAGGLQVLDVIKIVLPHAQLPVQFSANDFYWGAIPLFFLIYGMFKKEARRSFFFWLFLVALFAAVRYSPVYFLFSKLPLLNGLRQPGRWLLLAHFVASVLIASGFNHFLVAEQDKILERLKKFFRFITITLSLGLAGFSIANYFAGKKVLSLILRYFDGNMYARTTQLPIEHYHRVITQMFDRIAGSFSLAAFVTLASLLFLVIGYRMVAGFNAGSRNAGTFGFWAVAVTALNLSVISFSLPLTAPRQALEQKSEIVNFLQSHPGKYFSFLPGFTEYEKLTVPYSPGGDEIVVFQAASLPPNMGLLYGLAGADYYNNLMPRRMSRLLAYIGSDRATVGEKLSEQKITVAQKIRLLEDRRRVLDMLGIRYIVSAYPLNEVMFNKVLTVSVTGYDIPLMVYENTRTRPPVYLADRATIIPESEDGSYLEVIAGDLPANNVVVECISECNNTVGRALGQAEILESKNGYWKIRVTTPQDRWLVISENNLPGWSATVNGRLSEIRTVNSVFMGVSLPAGTSEVELRFTLRNLISSLKK